MSSDQTLFDRGGTPNPAAVPRHLPHPEPQARATDPDTSRAAAASVRSKVAAYRAEVLRAINYLQQATDQETHTYLMDHARAQSETSTRSRRSELLRLGLVADSGTRGLTEAGRSSIRWEITIEGGREIAGIRQSTQEATHGTA